MVVKIQVEVFWVMKLRSVMVGHFWGPCCLATPCSCKWQWIYCPYQIYNSWFHI